MKTRLLVPAGALALSLFAGACSTNRAYTRGTYEDPNTIEMLSDHFNENDLQLIAKTMVNSLAESAAFQQIQGRPVIVIGRMKNSTSEHIDMKSLADKMQVDLMKTGKFVFTDKDTRKDVAEELEYQGSGYVDPNTQKTPGQQIGADYMLTGEISSIVQQVGRDKMVYYKMTTKLHNLRTNIIEWSEEKQLRKKFVKKGVSW